LLGLNFNSEDGGNMFLLNFGWLSKGLHSVIFQKTELFTTTIARTSNPAYCNIYADRPILLKTHKNTIHIVTCLLKAETVERIDAAIARHTWDRNGYRKIL
jgi:hypothetical protein